MIPSNEADIRYLSFGIGRYDGDLFGEADYKYECGQIIYDINGKVLLDCIKTRSDKCFFWLSSSDTYEEIDTSDIFMDDIVLITELDCNYVTSYAIYKLINDRLSSTRSNFENNWNDPYRHWCFKSKKSVFDSSLTKKTK